MFCTFTHLSRLGLCLFQYISYILRCLGGFVDFIHFRTHWNILFHIGHIPVIVTFYFMHFCTFSFMCFGTFLCITIFSSYPLLQFWIFHVCAYWCSLWHVACFNSFWSVAVYLCILLRFGSLWSFIVFSCWVFLDSLEHIAMIVKFFAL